jgi:hypothetical protein
MAPVLEGKWTGLDQKTVLKGELLIWRTKNQARDQGMIQLKDSICFKSVQIGSFEMDPRPSSKVHPSDPSPVLGGSHFFNENL